MPARERSPLDLPDDLLHRAKVAAAQRKTTLKKLVQTGLDWVLRFEVHVNLARRGVSQSEATRIVRDFADWPVVDDTLELLEAALDEQVRWRISLWDSLILAAAHASGASELITEDLSHGQNYGGVRAVNPFL